MTSTAAQAGAELVIVTADAAGAVAVKPLRSAFAGIAAFGRLRTPPKLRMLDSGDTIIGGCLPCRRRGLTFGVLGCCGLVSWSAPVRAGASKALASPP